MSKSKHSLSLAKAASPVQPLRSPRAAAPAGAGGLAVAGKKRRRGPKEANPLSQKKKKTPDINDHSGHTEI